MMAGGQGRHLKIRFEPERAESWLPRLRGELRKDTVTAVTLDMTDVLRIDPSALRLLAAAGTHASEAGIPIFLDGVRTPVYKAIQLAKLGAVFRRVQHG
jgi:anti-anti-sigma regulatory factor